MLRSFLYRGAGFLRESGLLVRSLSRDIGQPTHYTHPELISKDEGEISGSTVGRSWYGILLLLVMPGVHKKEFAERRRKLME